MHIVGQIRSHSDLELVSGRFGLIISVGKVSQLGPDVGLRLAGVILALKYVMEPNSRLSPLELCPLKLCPFKPRSCAYELELN